MEYSRKPCTVDRSAREGDSRDPARARDTDRPPARLRRAREPLARDSPSLCLTAHTRSHGTRDTAQSGSAAVLARSAACSVALA